MEHRGIEFEVKQKEAASARWRWIIYRSQGQGPVVLGDIVGTYDDAVAKCKNEIDKGIDRKILA
jgi:hypothetical protein